MSVVIIILEKSDLGWFAYVPERAGMPALPILLAEEATDVGGGSFDGDREAAVGGDVEGFSGRSELRFVASVKLVGGLAGNDFHELGRFGSEVIGSREDDSEGFARSAFGDDGVGDDFAVEVNIGLGVGGDVGEFHGGEASGGRGRNPVNLYLSVDIIEYLVKMSVIEKNTISNEYNYEKIAPLKDHPRSDCFLGTTPNELHQYEPFDGSATN